MKKILLLTIVAFCVTLSLFSQSFTSKAPVTPFAATGINGAFTAAVAHPATSSIYLPYGYTGGYSTKIVKYDVSTNTWGTPINGPAGMGPTFGFAFNLNDEIYFGGGVGGGWAFASTVYKFNIGSSTFTPMDNVINSPIGRSYGFSFAINGKGYVGEGFGGNGSAASMALTPTFVKFDPTQASGSQWSTMTPYPGLGEYLQAATSLNGFGYAGLGCTNIISPYVEQTDFYQYNPTSNTWTAMSSFPGTARECAMLFPVCNKIILMGGYNRVTNAYYNDIWSFDPTIGATGTWTPLGTNAIVLGAQNGRYGPSYAEYNGDMYFGMGAGATNRNQDWNLGSCFILLPIELTSFTGENIGSVNKLEWVTASEINNDAFVIEKSYDGNEFEPCGSIKGAGNSNVKLNYTFFDENPYALTYYKLKQIDNNGNSTTSNIITIKKAIKGLEIYNVIPNPNNGTFKVIINSNESVDIKIKVINMLGQYILQQSNLLSKGVNTLSLTEIDLISGYYFLQISTIDGVISAQKQIIIK